MSKSTPWVCSQDALEAHNIEGKELYAKLHNIEALQARDWPYSLWLLGLVSTGLLVIGETLIPYFVRDEYRQGVQPSGFLITRDAAKIIWEDSCNG